MHTTLNVHPADGVQGCEEMYVDMAKEMGVDYENEDPVVCDPASQKFMEAYFKYLHHPREAEGVDFWWIDWQQGSNCKVEGLIRYGFLIIFIISIIKETAGVQ